MFFFLTNREPNTKNKIDQKMSQVWGANSFAVLSAGVQKERKVKDRKDRKEDLVEVQQDLEEVQQEDTKSKNGYRSLTAEEQLEFFGKPELPDRNRSKSPHKSSSRPQKPWGPPKDIEPEERKALAKKWNTYIGHGKWDQYKEYLKKQEAAGYPYQKQTCYYNSNKRDAPCCYLNADWCPYAHPKQHSEPFQTAICLHDVKGRCRNGKKCKFLHESFITDNGPFPGIFIKGTEEEPGDETFESADQPRILLLTRTEGGHVIFKRYSWNQLINVLKHDAERVFESKDPEVDFYKIKFWGIKWRNIDTDNWTLVVVDDSITKAKRWVMHKPKDSKDSKGKTKNQKKIQNK